MNINIKRTIKYVSGTILKEKPFLLFVYFLKFLCQLAILVQVVIIPKFLIDEIVLITQKTDVEVHLKNAVFYVLLTLAINFSRDLINALCDHYKSYTNEYFNQFCRLQVSGKSLSMDFEETENPETLNKLNMAQEGIDWYSGGIIGISDQFFTMVSAVLSCVTISGLIIWKCPVLLPLQIICVILSAVINGKANSIEVKYFDQMAKVNRMFGYYFWSFIDPKFGKDIRLYNAENLLIDKSDKFNDEICDMFYLRSVEQRRWWYLSTGIGVVRNIITNGYICWKAIMKVFSIGEISMMLSAFGNFYQNIWQIIWSSQELTKRSHYFVKFLDFLDLPETKQKGTDPVTGNNHEIEFRHVYFKYPRSENFVLEDVNIKIKSGEHLSVVGLNGAGKTTFIKLLCRLYDVTDGEILIDGKNIKDYDEEEYKKLFSVVFQDFKIFAFSIRENIALAQSQDSSEEKGRDEKLESILKQTGLYEDVQKLESKMDTPLSKQYEKGGIEFSGGQQQKTAISRALYRNSPIVILDEPTAALDPVAEYEIYRQFNTLVGGKTAVYISHRLSSCKFCDKIAVFSEGTIKEYGSHDELVKRSGGIYAEMFAEQAKYYA